MAAARGDAGTFTVGYIPRRSPGEGLLRFLRQPETIAVGSRHRPGAASGPALLGRDGFYLWVQARHADAKVELRHGLVIACLGLMVSVTRMVAGSPVRRSPAQPRTR